MAGGPLLGVRPLLHAVRLVHRVVARGVPGLGTRVHLTSASGLLTSDYRPRSIVLGHRTTVLGPRTLDPVSPNLSSQITSK